MSAREPVFAVQPREVGGRQAGSVVCRVSWLCRVLGAGRGGIVCRSGGVSGRRGGGIFVAAAVAVAATVVVIVIVVFEGSTDDLRDFAGVDVYAGAEAGHSFFFLIFGVLVFSFAYDCELCSLEVFLLVFGFYSLFMS